MWLSDLAPLERPDPRYGITPYDAVLAAEPVAPSPPATIASMRRQSAGGMQVGVVGGA